MMFYKKHVFCCTNRREPGRKRGCCAEKNSDELRDYMKGKVKELGISRTRINSSGCVDRCAPGPTMVIDPAGSWYPVKTKEDVAAGIQKHLVEGGRVERLMLPGSE